MYGWARIGVILALEEYEIRSDIVCCTSIGALVGAVYSGGKIDRFKEWAVGLTIKSVISFMDIALNGGMLKGERLMEFLRRNFIDCSIEDLKILFGAVATALDTGAEVWLQSGPTLDAVRASIALPGLSDDDSDEQRLPPMLDVVASSLNIMQVRITRSRMAGEPPDIILTPRLAHFGLLDFHQAQEAIEAGRQSVESYLPALKEQRLSVERYGNGDARHQ